MYFWNLFNKCIYENMSTNILYLPFNWKDYPEQVVVESQLKQRKFSSSVFLGFFFHSFDILLD